MSILKNSGLTLVFLLFTFIGFAQKENPSKSTTEGLSKRELTNMLNISKEDSLEAIEEVESEEKVLCKIGVYINSIPEINISDGYFQVDGWMWFNFNDSTYNPIENIEILNAYDFKHSEDVDGPYQKEIGDKDYWMLKKLNCKVEADLSSEDYPFDIQQLHIHFEDKWNDTTSVILQVDTVNMSKNIDQNAYLESIGWKIKEFTFKSSTTVYNSNYGDEEYDTPYYSRASILIPVRRLGWGLFYKTFTGVYIGFLIAWISLLIAYRDSDPRFGLPVGGLFTVVGNKYFVESSMPISNVLTLVDEIHSLTYIFIFAIISHTVINMYLIKEGKVSLEYNRQRHKYDQIAFALIGGLYLLLNIVLVYVYH